MNPESFVKSEVLVGTEISGKSSEVINPESFVKSEVLVGISA